MNIAFQRKTDLALLALRTLHAHGGSLPGPDLASEIGTTVTFLPQVMSAPIRAGWVVSERGPGGGYRLTSAAFRVTLYDLIHLLEGGETGRCVFRDAPCPGAETCPIHNVWLEAREAMVQGFKEISILEEGEKR